MFRESRLGWWDLGERSTGNEIVPTFGEITMQFEDPSGLVKEGTDLQRFRLKVRKSQALTGNPMLQVDLLSPEGDYLATPIPETEVASASEGGEVVEGAWDAIVLPNPEGMDLRAQLQSRNYWGKTSVEVAAMQWYATLVPGTGTPPTFYSLVGTCRGTRISTRGVMSLPLMVPSGALVPTGALVPNS